MYRLVFAALAVAFLGSASPAADAQTARQARQEVEASMLVTGHVDIDREGRVSAHVLDQPDRLPPLVVDLVERTVPGLRFDPILVDGAPVLARAQMRMRLVATPVGNGDMRLRIASAHFGETHSATDRTSVQKAGPLQRPRYPMEIARMGGMGTVYLLVKVGADGKVEDVMAEQVNLTAVGSAREMQRVRDTLSKTAVDNARRHWMFSPPTEGEEASKSHWVVRVPVDFFLDHKSDPAYGQWAVYHPGLQIRPSWAAPVLPGFSPDTLVAGAMTPETSRFKLLTPFEG